MAKISVIVPVYNAEKYLHRCIDSILAQTFTDFELLLINDGSKDRSGAICDEYLKKDSRVRTFHKPNGGVSSARRLGLENANGQWIMFVDADDWIESDTLECFLKYAKQDCDIVVFEHNLNAELSKEEYAPKLFNFSWWTVWGKLFRRDILNPEIIDIPRYFRVGEDFFVNLKSLDNIQGKVICRDIKKYHYNTDNPESANALFARTYEYELSVIKEARRLIKKFPFYSGIETAYFNWLIMYLAGFMGLGYKVDYSEDWIKDIREISSRVRMTRFQQLAIKAIDNPIYRTIFIMDKQSKRLAKKLLIKCKILKKC